MRRSPYLVFIASHSTSPHRVQRFSRSAQSAASVSSSVNVTSPNGGFDCQSPHPPNPGHGTLESFSGSPPSNTSANLQYRSAWSNTSTCFQGRRYTSYSNTRSHSHKSKW